MLSTARALDFRCPSPPPVRNHRSMDSQAKTARGSPRTGAPSPPKETDGGDAITLREWQGWGTSSPIPALVADIINDLKALERDMDAQMSFGGLGGKLQGDFKAQEDKKHRATYRALTDSEKKLQFFAARQIACRLLGSRGYLCQKCWLALEDCMCSRLLPCSLWPGIRFWLYMHPKDFLRQNNTGKLLWQLFGIQASSLCLFGIREHEEIMWDALKLAGTMELPQHELSRTSFLDLYLTLVQCIYFCNIHKETNDIVDSLSMEGVFTGRDMVWCLYPNKIASTKSIQDICSHGSLTNSECQSTVSRGEEPFNFILIDGACRAVMGDRDLPCISLSMPGVSVMHKLRPQPSWDRTCTAAAAIGLLSELHLLPTFSSLGLDKQAEAVENGLDALLDALTARRLRMGRSITRRERSNNI